jgi:hypothetical protein
VLRRAAGPVEVVGYLLDRPLDDGIAYVVVTIRAGKIIEMKGCADRAAAIAYSQSGATLG